MDEEVRRQPPRLGLRRGPPDRLRRQVHPDDPVAAAPRGGGRARRSRSRRPGRRRRAARTSPRRVAAALPPGVARGPRSACRRRRRRCRTRRGSARRVGYWRRHSGQPASRRSTVTLRLRELARPDRAEEDEPGQQGARAAVRDAEQRRRSSRRPVGWGGHAHERGYTRCRGDPACLRAGGRSLTPRLVHQSRRGPGEPLWLSAMARARRPRTGETGVFGYTAGERP